MWTEIIKHMPEFHSAVLTAIDAAGSPFSLRCHPRPDPAIQALRFDIWPGLKLQTGKACLLFHKHDERLWNLKSFVVRGSIIQDESGWLLQPERFIPGIGIGGIRNYLSFVVNGRKHTTRYLKRRGLKRPKIAWNELAVLMERADGEP